ncbi:hypothetical protein UFOVP10_59 [uncultured Caudovirales phage]|uniref:Glycine-rich domain-containing protein n=1 Tax=uncultured Caudovirales phage TaxID=2100421 RepID=A0A6J5KIP2_9CAUD|nr:hypothetical protein UFOVP10_59 [uncultured Caudovirales phage]
MTQSYNLSQLANNLNSAGQLDATDGLSGAVPAANGGTGQSGYTVGDILYASGATALAKLSDVATGNALLSGGVAASPSWGKIGLTTHISGTLGAANGGTGLSTIPLNNVVLGNGTSAVQTVAPGTAGNVLTSNGTTWSSSAATGTTGPRAQLFTTVATGQTFTIPAGITNLKVTVVGGGGASGSSGSFNCGPQQSGGSGGSGASAVQWLIGLTPGNTLTVAVGAAGSAGGIGAGGGSGGTSSVASGTQSITTIQCTGGGGGGVGGATGNNPGTNGSNGTATGVTNGGSGAAGYSFAGYGANVLNYGMGRAGTLTGGSVVGTQGGVLIEY